MERVGLWLRASDIGDGDAHAHASKLFAEHAKHAYIHRASVTRFASNKSFFMLAQQQMEVTAQQCRSPQPLKRGVQSAFLRRMTSIPF